ncbi:hypothetical protein Gotri_022149 [Gossypium trilobum]|uniref:Zinc knuckle CX2CX4HX4C domain-containing protein n=1 Tax=Gossypium trilobum TaxID=34281 RepID=A0A7J9DF91_9ROSI|nr:hypothetical protein [Gossypium trilobum]
MESTECEGGDEGDLVNCSTKKVPIQGMEEDWDVVMDTTLVAEMVLSWKDRLVGMGLRADERTTTSDGLDGAKEFRLLEEDVERSLVNGIPSINFSERVNQILIKHMEHIVVTKLLGRSIGSAVSKHSYGMDPTSYITGHMCKLQILREIGGMIGKVAKFDFNTDNSVRGRFARIAVFINLDRALITQVLVKRVIQWIEYEYLLIVCLLCDYYGHLKEICPKEVTGPEEFGIGITGNRREQRQISKENKEVVAPNPGTYRPWMLAERWGRRTLRTERKDSGSCGWVKSGPRPRSFRPFSVEPKRGRRPFAHKSKLAEKGWVKLGYPSIGQSLDRK